MYWIADILLVSLSANRLALVPWDKAASKVLNSTLVCPFLAALKKIKNYKVNCC